MDTIFLHHPSPHGQVLIRSPVSSSRLNLKINIARSTTHLWRTSGNFLQVLLKFSGNFISKGTGNAELVLPTLFHALFVEHIRRSVTCFFVEWRPVKISFDWTKFDTLFLRFLELCSVKLLPRQSQELSIAEQNAARGKVVKAVRFKGQDRPQAVQIDSIWFVFSRIFVFQGVYRRSLLYELSLFYRSRERTSVLLVLCTFLSPWSDDVSGGTKIDAIC